MLVGSLGITVWAWRGALAEVEHALRADFEFHVRDTEARVARRMRAHEQVLRGGAGLFAGSAHVDRKGFRDYVAALRLEGNYPGIQGVGFSVIVPPSSKDAHTAAVRREGFPAYSIRPEGERALYTSILYLEPFTERNQRAFGYDMFSERVRRAAMEQARDTGEAALSGKVTLVQEAEPDVQAGALMYVPVYRSDARTGSVTERRAAILGWVYSPFRMNDLMRGTFGGDASEVTVEIFDGDQPRRDALMYSSAAGASAVAGDRQLQAERPLEIAGHRWTMVVRSRLGHASQLGHDRPRLVLATGAVASALLALLVWALARGRARAFREARELDREVAERRRAESSLRESEELYRSLFTLAPSGVVLIDEGGQVLAFNDRAHEQLGYTREEFGRLSIPAIHAGPLEEEFHASIRRTLAVGQREFEVRHRMRSGEIRDVLVRSRRVESGGETRLLAVWEDITERRRAEEALRRREALFRAVLEGSADFLGILAADGRCKFVGGGASAVVGWSEQELLSQVPFANVHPDDRAIVEGAFESLLREPGGVRHVTYRFRHKDASWRVLDTTARNLLGDPDVQGVVMNRRDVTEQEELREQFHRAQKLETVGRLAGGIAHDFNNLLTVVLSCAEELKRQLSEGAPARLEEIDEILTAGQRAADLTRQLLAFARKQVIRPVPLDLNVLVRGTEKMMKRILGEDVDLVTSWQAEPWTVRADPGQVEQIVLNLAVNARDAMPTGGRLEIETRNVEADGRAGSSHPGVRAGQYVQLTLRDTGHGMTPKVKEHLFEPFFTTKPTGKGTGLGLATVYGIVRQNGGHILVDSEPGKGTSFAILLPRSDEDSPAEDGASEPEPRHPPAMPAAERGSETVLVVEDDPQVREVTVRSLRAGGYRVLVARDGQEALSVAESDDHGLDLLVSDVIMPRGDGPAVAESLRRRQPNLRALFISGYTQNVISERGVLPPGVELLQKPFTASSLLDRVRAVLDA